ncbi:hypothetical protein NDU88_004835 [Pleurodeles waltl]|uniref:Uncharacterized protein n=1 Tax=Pleurodeles waltl TaxID=8319 RepID=A0AAV7MB62_PLEWA|nr:hypothetical protein NDU88_004835 [Pleurodeles waltl]
MEPRGPAVLWETVVYWPGVGCTQQSPAASEAAQRHLEHPEAHLSNLVVRLCCGRLLFTGLGWAAHNKAQLLVRQEAAQRHLEHPEAHLRNLVVRLCCWRKLFMGQGHHKAQLSVRQEAAQCHLEHPESHLRNLVAQLHCMRL